MFTDSHCHLTFPELASSIDEIRTAMVQAAVDRALCVCTTLEEFDAVHALALRHDNFWASVGVHPDNEDVREPKLDDLVQGGQLPKVLAIGETGLDYYRLGTRTVADMEWQRERFRVHIRAARQVHKPLIIHTRSASDDTLSVLREEGECGDAGSAGGVFHCFTESLSVARAALDLGFYVSFSGILTFKSAQDLREVAAFVPLDRLLIETDSPYLAPVPYRGKTNNPSYVPWVAKQLAQIHGCTAEDIARVTSANFDALFMRPAACGSVVRTFFAFGSLCLSLWVQAAFAGSYDEFFMAVRQDNPIAIQQLLARGFDPNTPNVDGQTGLLMALRESSFKAAAALLQSPDTKVEMRSLTDESPLMLAALRGNVELCEILIARDADVNKSGWTPLHYAATGGYVAIVRLLLEHYAYIDAESPNGSTPLMMAAMYGNVETVQALLDAGADASLQNHLGLNAYDFAVRGSRPDAEQLLAPKQVRVVKDPAW